ncbi:MAG: hypothetical protein JWM28_2806 [Chitinophagaceae bacterium]|nr:hypothetical protein [Chitinophagaceae bacterium]
MYHKSDYLNLGIRSAEALYFDFQQRFLNDDELCLSLVTINSIETFDVRLKNALKRQHIEDVGDLLKCNYRDYRFMPQIGSKGQALILHYLKNMTRDLFIF